MLSFPASLSILLVCCVYDDDLGIPFGLLLTFKFDLALPGLWTGMAVALLFGAAITTLIVLQTDWEEEVLKVGERLGEERGTSVLPLNE